MRLADAARDAAVKVPVLEPEAVAFLAEHARELARPGPLDAGKADEEVALAVQAAGHSCRCRPIVYGDR